MAAAPVHRYFVGMATEVNPIRFTAHFGEETRKVLITQLNYLGEQWFVYINGLEVAEIFYRQGEYYYHDDILQAEDVQAIVDAITSKLRQPYHEAKFHFFAPRWVESYRQKVRALLS